MTNFQASHKKETKNKTKNPAGRSIMLRWAFANTVFCFITFTIFAALIYQLTVTTYINEEKSSMMQSVSTIENVLSQSETALSLQNLRNFIDFSSSSSTGDLTGDAHDIVAPQSLSSMIGHRKSFFIFGTDKRLLYSTADQTIGFQNAPNNKIVEYQGNVPGFVLERRIVSKKTGQTVGYLQAFYDMSFYHNISRKLLASLSILEILALVIAQIIGYYMASRFMRPLEKLHKEMKSVAKTPDGEFLPIELKTGDEIEELADAYNDMMQKTHNYLEQQRRFVSDVSHELRTPLAVLDGHINLLNRWGKNDPEILNESLQASREEIVRMKGMLEEMLALSRLENVDLDLEKMDCNPAKVLGFTLKNFKLVHEDFDISLDNQLKSDAHAKIYENHYEQGIMILLDNAAKYSPDESKIIHIILSEDEDFIITSVTDHGIGMSEDDMGHIFERFFRADKARNREIGGTGLGLPIISSIVEKYQGEIEVSSELGIGSTFTLKIPKMK